MYFINMYIQVGVKEHCWKEMCAQLLFFLQIYGGLVFN